MTVSSNIKCSSNEVNRGTSFELDEIHKNKLSLKSKTLRAFLAEFSIVVV